MDCSATHADPLRVLVPYTREASVEVVLSALMSEGIEPEILRMSHETSYWELLAFRWAVGASFVVVEQDVIPSWGAIRAMDACPSPWCTCEAMIGGALYPTSLGCVKFSSSLMRQSPRLIEDLADRSWHSLDWQIAGALAPAGPHVHQPPAHHLNVGHWTPDDRWAYERASGRLRAGDGNSFPDRWEALPQMAKKGFVP